MKQTTNEIGLVDKFDKLMAEKLNVTEISVTIAVLSDDGKPGNFQLRIDTPKASNGGLHARIFASEYGTGGNANIFSYYGPEVRFGAQWDYEHALRAYKRVDERMGAMYAVRGNAADAAEAMGRWLEACGVSKVYLRPDSAASRSWLNKGEWLCLTIGEFVNRVRGNLHVAPVVVEEAVGEAVGEAVQS